MYLQSVKKQLVNLDSCVARYVKLALGLLSMTLLCVISMVACWLKWEVLVSN